MQTHKNQKHLGNRCMFCIELAKTSGNMYLWLLIPCGGKHLDSVVSGSLSCFQIIDLDRMQFILFFFAVKLLFYKCCLYDVASG